MFSSSAFDLSQREAVLPRIVTFCKDLDQAIGPSVVRAGLITEFVGEPGSGKTQMCFQLCVNANLPPEVGGLGGKSLFIDTNFGYNPFRLREIAEACVDHCRLVVGIHRAHLVDNILNYTVESILESVLYDHVHDCKDMDKSIDTLERILKRGEKIRLVVIDSYSFFLRCNIVNTLERVAVDHRILQRIQLLAEQFEFAVVITNDLTTKVNRVGPSLIVPALGDNHGHRINQRIILGRTKQINVYVASVEKSSHRPPMAVKFEISKAGVRGVGAKYNLG